MVDPDKLIRFAMDARLDRENLMKSISWMEEMYDDAGFSEKSMYRMLRKPAMEHGTLSASTLFQKACPIHRSESYY